ncbi:hypothetical protein BDZ89DRAFT_1142311 [Hymenopellis radicata]|nr:hypothetical protein BDZ89DRAFT_1142311 [Hymenopellis radicata]
MSGPLERLPSNALPPIDYPSLQVTATLYGFYSVHPVLVDLMQPISLISHASSLSFLPVFVAHIYQAGILSRPRLMRINGSNTPRPSSFIVASHKTPPPASSAIYLCRVTHPLTICALTRLPPALLDTPVTRHALLLSSGLLFPPGLPIDLQTCSPPLPGFCSVILMQYRLRCHSHPRDRLNCLVYIDATLVSGRNAGTHANNLRASAAGPYEFALFLDAIRNQSEGERGGPGRSWKNQYAATLIKPSKSAKEI